MLLKYTGFLVVTSLFMLMIGQSDGDPLSFKCMHRRFTLPIGRFFPVTLSITDSYNSSIRIQSPCCDLVTLDNATCSSCSKQNEKECYIDTEHVLIEFNGTENTDCKNKTTVGVTCLASKCRKNNSVYNPGQTTECSGAGEYDICMASGEWNHANCTNETSSTSSEGTPPTVPATSPPISPPSISSDGTTGTGEYTNNGSAESINETITTRTSQPGWMFTSVSVNNDTSTEMPFDAKKAKKDLYTFLIVLGAVLALVFVLVCGFFIKKQRSSNDKFSRDNYPLEYWHDQDYVDRVVERGFCSKNSFTVNPVYGNEKHLPNKQTYKKKEEPFTAAMRDNGRQSGDKSNGSANRTTHKGDVPRSMKHDYTDKYVATATGSHFYSYRKSPEEETTNLDESVDNYEPESPSIPRGTKIYPNTTSFKPLPRPDKKYQKRNAVKRHGRHSQGETCDEDKRSNTANGTDDIYAMSYKKKLREKLDDWSAEESDV